MKIHTSILWKTCHTKRRSHTRKEGLKKKVKNVNMVDILSIQEWI
jgi:hypothetical protein